MPQHPYHLLPDSAFWRKSVEAVPYSDLDPVEGFSLRLGKHTKVATAGSCFAQHISRYLQQSGFHYLVTEPGHPIIPRHIQTDHGYGLFSARYGNIYTARQLLQLYQRAYGLLVPEEPAWESEDRSIVDPFRPTVQPGGYDSLIEMEMDREQHLAAVRKMFEQLDVFVFTLGLTECWRSPSDGVVFPLCPGVKGGIFDSAKYAFYNQTVEDVISDLREFLSCLTSVNPKAQMLLTVSPVPLVATAQSGSHVLSATSYSKSVLRVAAEQMSCTEDRVHYFPAYEIVTGAYNRGRYFAPDLRNVTEEGVSHVMRLLLKHAAGIELSAESGAEPQQSESMDRFLKESQEFVDVECDELALDDD